MPKAATATNPRAARPALVTLAALAVLVAPLPPLVPPYHPGAQLPMWIVIAALSAGLAVLVTVRTATPRGVLLALGWVLVALVVVHGFIVGDLIAMFATWLAVPVLALFAGQLRPKPRKALIAAHAVAAACWIGIAVTFVGMAVIAMSINDLQAAKAIYRLMAALDVTLLPWSNFATVLTGLALSFATKWGLTRYYWVIAKAIVAVVILAMAFGFLHDAVEAAGHEAAELAAAGGSVDRLGGAADVVLWGFACAWLGLVAALLLSLYKPGGATRRGRRLTAGTTLHPRRTSPQPVAG